MEKKPYGLSAARHPNAPGDRVKTDADIGPYSGYRIVCPYVMAKIAVWLSEYDLPFPHGANILECWGLMGDFNYT